MPQAPRFTPEPGDIQADHEAQEVTQVAALFEAPHDRPPDVKWGGLMHKLEAQLGMDQQGRSWCFPVERKPLVQPTSPQKQWNGGKVAYWERMQLWVLQKQERPLKPSPFRLFKRQLGQLHQFWDPESLENPGDIQAKLEAYMIGHQVDVTAVQMVLQKAKEEAQAWQKQETHRGAIDLYCFLCKKVAIPQPSTKQLETGFALTVCCEPDQILLEQICPTMFGCRYHDS